MRFNVERYYGDIRRILQSKFDCRQISVDEIVHNAILNMLIADDYDPARGGPTTYIWYKLRTTYLNHFQKSVKSKEVPLEDNKEAFKVPYEKQVDDFHFVLQKTTPKMQDFYGLLVEGHSKKEAGAWLGLEQEDSELCFQELKEISSSIRNH